MRKAFVLAPLMFILTGCGGLVDRYMMPVEDDTAYDIYELAIDSMAEKKYYHAAEYFLRIQDEYPFSPFIIDAELGLADAYFLDERYLEAAEAYINFEYMHPRHEALPYVMYQIAKSYRLSFTSMDRSTKDIEKGLQYALNVVGQYPNSQYAEAAQEEATLLRTLIAKRQIYIADVYWHMENYESAWYRYSKIVEEFQELPEIQEYAQKQADASYIRFRQTNSNLEREEREGSWKDYFDWL